MKYLFEYTDLRRQSNWEQNNVVMESFKEDDDFEDEMSYFFDSMF